MLISILELLKNTEIGKSELIDIAKGKYKAPQNYTDFKKRLKWRLLKK